MIKAKDVKNVSDGFHTFDELYKHRVALFIILIKIAHEKGWECGFSKNHLKYDVMLTYKQGDELNIDDYEACFGGGWLIGWIVLPNGDQVRYHFSEDQAEKLPATLEKELCWPCGDYNDDDAIKALYNYL